MNLCRSTSIFILVLITLSAGCGKKTRLIPPQKLVPVRITDLRYVLDEKGVTLKWSYPTKMENGDSLQAIESFEIYRAGIPEGEYCQGCPVQFEDQVEIDGGRLPGAGETRTAVYTETNLKKDYHYFFKIRSRAGWWYPSGDSNIVSFFWSAPPEMVRDLLLESGDKKLTLRWDPVRQNTSGETLEEQSVMYQVYRKKDGEDFSALAEPVGKPEFVDNDVIIGQQYSYKVRALIKRDDSWLKGEASRTVSVMGRDLNSLKSPRHLLAVKVPEGVKIVWQGIGSGDLAGYRIYRREGNSDQAEILAEVGPDQDYYIDRSDTKGRMWSYSVTSFDTAEPANESVPSAEAVIDLRLSE